MNTVHTITLNETERIARPRSIERLVRGVPTSDGAGVRLNRVLTQDLQQRLDPYLMLDNFSSDNPDDYIAGFPDHPHRGFETITYMIEGRMRHRDSAGHEGLLQNGGVQWMTAGSGLVHSELPEQESGRMDGFQLWLNLPARDKMTTPGYRDIQSAEIPEFTLGEAVWVRVIAGSSHGVAGAVQRPVTAPLYLDVHFDAAGDFTQAVPEGFNGFVFAYRGDVEVGEVKVPTGQMAILANDGDGVVLRASAAARALLIAGKPLREPIAQYGPFVMNTREQLMQAVADFQAGKFHNQA